uniref:Uncharacterized protein n=1 Tax=Rhizophora mucronata TaxID=61149 RepID=A0A2P2N0P9_RHIMU
MPLIRHFQVLAVFPYLKLVLLILEWMNYFMLLSSG